MTYVKVVSNVNMSKSLLLSCLDNFSNSNLDFYEDIKYISNCLNIDKTIVIEYPNKITGLLIAHHLDCPDELHSIERIKMLLQRWSLEKFLRQFKWNSLNNKNLKKNCFILIKILILHCFIISVGCCLIPFKCL